MKKAIAGLAGVLLLSACGEEPASETEGDNREASGEVLEGTISDEMLPVDEVRSQAPLAAPDPATSGPSEQTPAPDDDGQTAPVDEEPLPEVLPGPDPAAPED